MTGSVIESVVIPATSLRRDGHASGPQPGSPVTRRILPLPTVPIPRTSMVVYGLAAVDCRGRVADRAVVLALGWTPGTRLDIRQI
ncbi:MAG: hypothetical protein WAL99_06380, partial [Pseudonocardiaceae bacterium]